MMLLRACFLVVLLAGPLAAAVTLASPFSDHAVLQHGQPLPVWGMALAGETVTVTCAGQSKAAIADQQGHWRVDLAPLRAGGQPVEMTVSGSSTITLKDLLVGEVWICSGQSNMAWTVAASRDANLEIPAAKYPQIRLFTVTKRTADAPLAHCGGAWTICSPESIADFSAVAYFFGRHLHQELQVPIGLINASWGGTPAEAWTSRKILEENPALTEVLSAWDKRMADLPKAQAKFTGDTITWEQAAAAARNAGKPVPAAPRAPEGHDSSHKPASLRNAMLSPLIPYAIRGAIWYQGEANAMRPQQYRTLLPAMIGDWRQAWGQGEFPFYFVQLANLHGRNWPEIREAQRLTAQHVPNTGMAVTIDIGERDNVHPRNKQDVGRRLALIALAKTYGRSIAFSGPEFKELRIEGAKAVVTFAHGNGGLAVRGGVPSGFEIAGDDGKFLPAEAVVNGDAVVLSHATISKPAAVRYAWSDNPEPSLFNHAGLPAGPFQCRPARSPAKESNVDK